MYRSVLYALLTAITCLSVACEQSPKQARRALIDKGYSYSRDDFAQSLQRADDEAVRLFLRAGMEPNVVSGGYAALEHAAPHRAIVERLLAAGADPNANGGVTTPLVEAATHGDVETLTLLLNGGADPNLADATDGTPLMAASQRGATDQVNMLLAAGADPNRRSTLGSTALALAQAGGYGDIARLLQEAGAKHSGGVNLAALMEPAQLDESAPERYVVRVATSVGDFSIEVERRWAPHAADRFYNLVRHGFFDDQRFFRVVPERLVQFGLHGVPEIAGRWYEATFPDDVAKLTNQRGTLAFASSSTPHSRTTQIFVNLSDNSDFDRMGFAPFARIVSGMENVERIHAGYGEVPEQQRILREGNAYLQRSFPKLDVLVEARLQGD